MNKYSKQLFPINIFHGSLSNNEELKEILIPYIEKHKNQLTSPPKNWITTNIITSFDNDDMNSIFEEGQTSKKLYSQYDEVLNKFFDKTWKTIIKSIWFNYYENGEFQEPHTHLGTCLNPTHFACVHFLKFDPLLHSKLTFRDPNVKLRNGFLEIDSNRYDEMYELHAKEGDLVMFPSYLEHFVKSGPPTPGNPRITISFNIKILKYGDSILCDMSK